MSNKARIQRECEKLNNVRNVFEGTIDCHSFFEKIHGNLMISGSASNNMKMLADLVCTCMQKDRLSTILLTSHLDLLQLLRERQNTGEITGVMISDVVTRNYHPFYGMSNQQLLHFVSLVAEEMGYRTALDKILVYGAALLNILSVHYPVSLPAMCALLKEDDDFISNLALEKGLSNIVADNIRGNYAAGVMFRRICEKMEEIFEEVYVSECETKYNFQSGACGNVPLMGYYTVSSSPRLMNYYLKEEIFSTLKRVAKIRVIVDEVYFVDENDKLLKYLLQMQRQGKIELIAVSRNIREALFSKAVDFENIVFFQHATPMLTETFSKELFGHYQYYFPAMAAGRPPAVLFTLKKDIRWQISMEERPRIRAEDMYGRQMPFGGKTSDYVAVKTTANDNLYLIKTAVFLPLEGEIMV